MFDEKATLKLADTILDWLAPTAAADALATHGLAFHTDPVATETGTEGIKAT